MAIPLVLSTGSWSLQGFINRMFLAWHSPESLAAAMPAGMVNYALLSLFIATTSYVSTFVAQYHGAGLDSRIGRMVWQAVPIALFAGLLNLALVPAAPALFRWVGHAPAVQVDEVTLFRILCLGAFPVVMFNAFSGVLAGLGRTTPVMVVTLAGTGLNIVLDWMLIFGNAGMPQLGIAGAGWANLAASVAQMAAYAVVVFGRRYRQPLRMLAWKPDPRALGALLRYGLPSGVQFFIDMIGFTGFVLLVGRLGRNELAATNLAFNVNTIAFMPMIGVGITVSVLVGQALGRNDPKLARASVRSAFDLAALYMGVVAGLFILVPRLFVLPFAIDSDRAQFGAIADLAVVLLRFVAVYTLFDAGNIIFSSAIKGAGDTRFVMWMILGMSLGILVIPSFVAITWLSAGVYACWTIASLYVISLGVAFFLRYRRGAWERMRVIEAPSVL
jgi:MATE family multidrug resistance protein